MAQPRVNIAPQTETNNISSSSEASTPSENDRRPPIHEEPPVGPGSANGPSMRKRRRLRRQMSSQHDPDDGLHQVPPQRSLLHRMLADITQLPLATYSYWRWAALFYILWMLITHLIATAYMRITEQFEPVCSLPWIGQKLVLCHHQTKASTKPVNLTKVSASQYQLESVMNSAGKGLGLAMGMLGHEYAIRDLSIRVKHSELSRRRDLGKELDELISLTTRASDGLSDFTARVASVTDSIIAFDRYAVRDLQAITARQETPPSLPQSFFSALSPFAAFKPKYKTELELKDVFMQTTSQMASRLPSLIEEAGHLRYLLQVISNVLDRIKGLALDEIKGSPEMAVLAELWAKMAKRDDYKEYKLHQRLLGDMMGYYANATEMMKDTVDALIKMRSDLNEFRDIHASPALAWRDVALEVTIEMMSESMRRLELGRRRIDGYGRVDETDGVSDQKYVTASIGRKG